MSQGDIECDVLIIGAGMTGSMLARHMHYEMPDLDILQVEAKTTFDHGIGESTVEAFEVYARWACKLGPYLEKWYVNKEALRYFFDNEEGSLKVAEMSEFGRAHAHTLRASQLDRSKFDSDIVEMNRKLGIRVMLGTKVLGGRKQASLANHITIDREGGHRVETDKGWIRCKWLVDAGGFAAPVSRLHGGFVSDKTLPVSSYWARFEDCNIIDELGDAAWKARNGNIQRFQSTSHFMYKGSWWWLIPVSDSCFSIGVCWHQEHSDHKLKLKNGDQLEALIRSFEWGRELLGENAKRVDFKALSNLAAYSTKRFSEDRWYLTGMASLVIDPLNSNTSRIFPENNTYIVDLIKSDRAGDADLHRRQLSLYELRMKQVYDGAYEAYRHYDYNGSYDVMVPFLMGNIATYFNMLVPDYMTQFEKIRTLAKTFDPDDPAQANGVSTFGKEVLGTYARLSQEMLEYVVRTGNYYSNNAGKMQDARMYEHRPGIHNKLFVRDEAAEAEQNLITFEFVFKTHVMRMAELEGLYFDEAAFQDVFERSFQSTQKIADVMRQCCRPMAASDIGTTPIAATALGSPHR